MWMGIEIIPMGIPTFVEISNLIDLSIRILKFLNNSIIIYIYWKSAQVYNHTQKGQQYKESRRARQLNSKSLTNFGKQKRFKTFNIFLSIMYEGKLFQISIRLEEKKYLRKSLVLCCNCSL